MHRCQCLDGLDLYYDCFFYNEVQPIATVQANATIYDGKRLLLLDSQSRLG